MILSLILVTAGGCSVIRVHGKGKWAYLYRAVNSRGDTIEFHLSQTRNANAAKRFPGKAWEKPFVINTDKAGCCAGPFGS